jgi:hypothetical protein
MTINNARTVGTPLRFSQNKGGELITAMKVDRRNGIKSGDATRSPATVITKAARVNNIFDLYSLVSEFILPVV